MRFRFLLAGALIALSGCGGGGDGAGVPGPSSKVFVADSGNRAIGSVIDPNPPPGTATVDRIIIGPGTGLGMAAGGSHVGAIPGLALDGATADRSFQLGNTPKYIFVDPANNRLYGVSENLVFIVNNLSAVNGPGVPATVIAVQTTGSPFSAVAVKP